MKRQLPNANHEQSAFNFFERQQSDRKKRTFEILSQFNPALATEVVYKDEKYTKGGVSVFDTGSYHHHHMRSANGLVAINKCSVEDRAAITIQRYWKGYIQFKTFNRILIDKFAAQEEAREVEEKKRVERWMIRKETEELEKQIEDRNRLF